jgi:hypothetical protein
VFSFVTSGKKSVVTRTLELPKSGRLAAQKIESSFTVTLDLAGLDPKSGTGKDVIKLFENVLLADLRVYATKSARALESEWARLGAELDKSTDRRAAQKLADAFEQAVADDWNDFAKSKGKSYAEKAFDYAVKDVAKTAKADMNGARIAFDADELKPARLGFLTSTLAGIVSAIAAGAATGGLGWFAAAIGGVAALVRGTSSSWKLAQGRAADMQANLNQIDTALERINKAMEGLQPRMDMLDRSRRALEAAMLESSSELAKLGKQVADLESRAKAEKSDAYRRTLATLHDRLTTLRADGDAVRKQIAKLDGLTDAMDKARNAVRKASDLSTADRKGMDAAMARFDKVGDDTNTALGAVASLLKEVSKLT